MSFVNPSYLWAFLGLLIPIAIHFWSNKTGKTIKVGSIQLFQESESSKSSSIKLNEFLLLALRSLLIGIVVLILAEPQLKKAGENSALTYIVEPSLLSNEGIKAMIDTLQTDDAIRILLPSLPHIDTYKTSYSNTLQNYWELAQEMQHLDTDSIVVFTSARKAGLKGMRPSINKAIEWVILDSEVESATEPVFAKSDESEIEIVIAKLDSELLSFETQKIDTNSDRISYNATRDSIILDNNNQSIALANSSPKKILVFYEDEHEDQLLFIESSINAVATYTNETITIEKTQTEVDNLSSYDLVIWFSNQIPPTTSNKIIQYKPNDYAHNIIEVSSTINNYYLTKRLTTNSLINYRFPEQLLNLLNENQLSEESLDRIDKRVVSKAELVPNLGNSDVTDSKRRSNNVTKWLWLLLIPILIFERILAKRRKQ